MNWSQFTSSTILCILLGIQGISHSQYYPRNDYDYHEEDYFASPSEAGEYFQTRSQHYQPFPEEIRAATYSQYYGTSTAALSKRTTNEGNDADNSQPSDSLASYRIRFNDPPTPEYPQYDGFEDSSRRQGPPNNYFEFEPPPPKQNPPKRPPPVYQSESPPPVYQTERRPPVYQQPERPPSSYPPQRASPRYSPPQSVPSRGIGIEFFDEGQMNIYVPDPERPNTRPQVFRINPNRRPDSRPQVNRDDPQSQGGRRRLPYGENEDDDRTPYAVVVIVDNRPTEQCANESQRVYRQNKRCYEPGTGLTPCGTLMNFYPEEGNQIYGDCDCLFDNGFVSRPLAYWRPHDRCYLLFQRGPCRYSEWLILDRDGYPQCASRSCPQSFDENERSQEFWFLYKGKCYKTGEYYASFCSPGQESWKVYFPFGKNQPQCMKGPPPPRLTPGERTLLSPVIDLRCKPGYKKMQNGDCKRVVRYDDDY